MDEVYMKSAALLFATVLGFGTNLYAGDTLYCYFTNHDRGATEYVKVSVKESFNSSSTQDFLGKEGQGVRSFRAAGNVLDSYLYEVESAKAVELVEKCLTVGKNKNASLERVVRAGSFAFSWDGYPFVFKGIDGSYFRLELPAQDKGRLTLKDYVLEKSGFQNPLLSSVIGGVDKIQSYHNVDDFQVIQKSLKGASFLLSNAPLENSSKDDVRDVMWYLAFRAAKNGDLFNQGAFLVEGDLQDRLFTILNTHSHKRISTHLKYLSDTSEHREVSFGGETILAAKRTALFFQVNKQGLNHLYIKPEDYSVDGWYDTLGHAWETIPSLLRKVLPTNRITGDDHALEYRKERVNIQTTFFEKYKSFVEKMEGQDQVKINNILNEYKKYGIFTMVHYLEQFPNDLEAQEILNDLESRYEANSLKARIGDEVHIHLDRESVVRDYNRLNETFESIIQNEANQFTPVNQ